jgi:uncharacterized protein involved in exopolysaccharide biosynthesis
MTEPANVPDNQLAGADDEISLLDLLIVFAKYKKLILGLPFVVAVLAAGITLLMPNIYTGTAVILPPQQSQSTASAAISQLGGVLGGLTGGVAGIKNPNDLYISMLKSRAVAYNIIRRFDLNKLWEQKIQSNTRIRLEGVTTITAGKDGLISIAVDDEDPKRAAAIANAYVDELMKLTQVLAVTEASQRRLFFERQLAQAEVNLNQSQVAARQGMQQDGLMKVDDQGRAMVEVSARLRAQITVKEVQIGAMRTFAADRNPDLRLAQQELESLKHELAKTEGTGGTRPAALDPPEKGLESLRLLRDVKYNEAMVELLKQQYGLAKIDEVKDGTFVQVLDKAIEPDRKSKPKRTQIVLLSALVAFFVGIFCAFVLEGMERAKADPEQATRLLDLKHYLAWR